MMTLLEVSLLYYQTIKNSAANRNIARAFNT